MTTGRPAKTYKVPVVGEVKDPNVYITLLTLWHCREGFLDHEEQCLWACDTGHGERYRIEFDTLDELVRLGWVSEVGVDRHEITPSGKRWLNLFLVANGGRPIKGGR